MKPIIELEGYVINKLTYGRLNKEIKDKESNDEGDFERKVSIGVSEDNKRALVILNISLNDFTNMKFAEAEVIGEFIVNEPLNEEEVRDLMAKNGVPLVYPYVRSIISMVSSLDSHSAMIIPTINTKIFRED